MQPNPCVKTQCICGLCGASEGGPVCWKCSNKFPLPPHALKQYIEEEASKRMPPKYNQEAVDKMRSAPPRPQTPGGSDFEGFSPKDSQLEILFKWLEDTIDMARIHKLENTGLKSNDYMSGMEIGCTIALSHLEKIFPSRKFTMQHF